MANLLLIDFGSTYTKVTAVDPINERILGVAKSFTTVETDIKQGYDRAVKELKEKIGAIDCDVKLACSSAAGGLRMVTIGLVPDLTVKASKLAALSAGAKVTKVFAYDLSLKEAEEIDGLKPDIVLLTGGTDGGNKDVILHNAKVLAQLDWEFPVVVAGNKSVSDRVVKILEESGKEALLCENVLPSLDSLNIEPVRECIRNVFLRRIIQAKGITKMQNLLEGILMPTPSAVLNAARLLALGQKDEPGWGDLMVVDVGGATTDVYSITAGSPTQTGVILKGFPEPYAKRTVEGDLGVRYSARALTEAVGLEKVMEYSKLTEEEVLGYLERYRQNPDLLSEQDEKMQAMDWALAALAVRNAVERHAGILETVYTPFGATFLQSGKDLTEIKTFIGTGGPVLNTIDKTAALSQCLFERENPTQLKPKNPDFFLDSKYILAAMGLLAEKYPRAALRIMKRELAQLV